MTDHPRICGAPEQRKQRNTPAHKRGFAEPLSSGILLRSRMPEPAHQSEHFSSYDDRKLNRRKRIVSIDCPVFPGIPVEQGPSRGIISQDTHRRKLSGNPGSPRLRAVDMISVNMTDRKSTRLNS